MRVTALELFAVPPRWLFLKLSTDEGIAGWGEPIVEGRAETVRAAVQELGEQLFGKDPFRIEDHFQVLWRGGSVFERDGHVDVPTGPGLGVEIDEERVRAAAGTAPPWHNPVWRNEDGTVAEW